MHGYADAYELVRTKAREDMLKLLDTVESVATKSLPLPVQIASFDC